MEGAGFYSSIKRRNEELDLQQLQTKRLMGTKVQGFIFRGISDFAASPTCPTRKAPKSRSGG